MHGRMRWMDTDVERRYARTKERETKKNYFNRERDEREEQE